MRRVIKIGGSLLPRDDLLTTVPDWIGRQPRAETLIVIGGGELIDSIRHLDKVRPSDPEKIHWMCVDLLESTFQAFSSWVDWPRIETQQQLSEAIESGLSPSTPTLVAVSTFYTADTMAEYPVHLPADWRTTTDSIAGLLATRVSADELVLLKACEIDPSASIEDLIQEGIVDEAFTLIRPHINKVRIEQLKVPGR